MIERASERRRASNQATIFFLDEIHRFNKAQQDALLPAVEEGLVVLIGATTENPYFEVNSALISRSQIYEFSPLGPVEVGELLRRALDDPERGIADPPEVADEALELIAARSGGDARTALAALERAVETVRSTRRRGRRRRRRGRAAAQGAPLRQGRRPPLRLHLGLDQGDPRLRRRRLPLLPRGDARGRRGPALHRPPDGDLRLRGHRQRRPAGARRRHRRRRRGRSRRPPRVPAQPRPGRGLPRAGAEVERLDEGPLARRSATSASTARSRRRPTSRTPTTPAPRSSAAAWATCIPHDQPGGVADQPLAPEGLEAERFYAPTDRGFEAELARRLENCAIRGRSRDASVTSRAPLVALGHPRSDVWRLMANHWSFPAPRRQGPRAMIAA